MQSFALMQRLFISLMSSEIMLILLHLIRRLSFLNGEMKLAYGNLSIVTIEIYHRVTAIRLARLSSLFVDQAYPLFKIACPSSLSTY